MKIVLFIIGLLFVSFTFAQEIESPQEIRTERFIEKSGDYVQFAPLAFSLISILDKKDTSGAWQLAKTTSTTILATTLLKHAINKPRPEGQTDGLSFPSGHTAFAFSGAAFIQKRYGWKYCIPAYLVAGYVGYSRIEGLNDRHDGWDVLAGAVVGIGSAYLFTTPYTKEHLELSYTSQEGTPLLGITYSF